MTLEEIQGNEAVVAALAGMVDSGRVPHAILFSEEDGGGAFVLCQAFLGRLYDSPKIGKLIHPDVHYVFPVLAGKLSVTYIAEFRELALRNPLRQLSRGQMGSQIQLVQLSIHIVRHAVHVFRRIGAGDGVFLPGNAHGNADLWVLHDDLLKFDLHLYYTTGFGHS